MKWKAIWAPVFMENWLFPLPFRQITLVSFVKYFELRSRIPEKSCLFSRAKITVRRPVCSLFFARYSAIAIGAMYCWLWLLSYGHTTTTGSAFR